MRECIEGGERDNVCVWRVCVRSRRRVKEGERGGGRRIVGEAREVPVTEK